MARIESDPNYTSPTFSRATAATDLFKKEDVQALAAAMSTHDHSTGKGLGLKATDISDWFRSTGHSSPFASTGSGLEMYYEPGTQGVIQTFNRGGSTYTPLGIAGSSVTLSAATNSGGTTGSTYMTLAYAGSPAAPSITTYATIWPSANPGIKFASGATMSDFVSGPDAYVAVSQLTVTPGKFSAASVNCNGPFVVAGGQTSIFGGAVTCQTTLTVAGATTHNGAINLGAAAPILFATGGQIADGGSGFISLSKLTVTPGAAAFSSVAFNGPITTGAAFAGSISVAAPASAAAGQISLGNGIGQGNGAQATMPLAKGTGFGPTGTSGVGWIQFNTNGTMIYVPYYV